MENLISLPAYAPKIMQTKKEIEQQADGASLNP